MSQPHTRKSFFSRIGTLFAASAFAPKTFAQSASKAVQHPQQGVKFRLEPDSRAIAREADSV